MHTLTTEQYAILALLAAVVLLFLAVVASHHWTCRIRLDRDEYWTAYRWHRAIGAHERHWKQAPTGLSATESELRRVGDHSAA